MVGSTSRVTLLAGDGPRVRVRVVRWFLRRRGGVPRHDGRDEDGGEGEVGEVEEDDEV